MDSEETIQELKKINNRIDRTNVVVEELLKWIRFDKMIKLKDFLERTLTTDAEKIMYELTDGEVSTREIAAKCNVTHVTVGNYWQRWRVLGILESTEKYSGKRYRKICSLSDMGIETPKIKVENTNNEKPKLEKSEENEESSDKEEVIDSHDERSVF